MDPDVHKCKYTTTQYKNSKYCLQGKCINYFLSSRPSLSGKGMKGAMCEVLDSSPSLSDANKKKVPVCVTKYVKIYLSLLIVLATGKKLFQDEHRLTSCKPLWIEVKEG